VGAADVSRLWRAGVLSVLLVGPILAYISLGALWLRDREWLFPATTIWIVSGIVFGILASRWTRDKRAILPPIDWDAPNTFSPFDRQAWTLVEEESEQGDTISMETLSGFDIYIETGRKLARRLAEHYHPLSNDPIEHVPVVELLTALELAAEDLNHLCRQIPGGDLVTAAHWKRAIQAAGYIQKANDIYGYLLPIFNPVTGLARLGTQQWMVKPAWKNMQQNVLRWFYRAYVNRLGTHLIELNSGRLAIGVEQYRRLTRKSGGRAAPTAAETTPLVIAVAGARDSEKGKLVELLKGSLEGDPTLLKARLRSAGLDESAFERLGAARWVDVPGYTSSPDGETARDRATRRDAIDESVEADLLILVIKARTAPQPADLAFAQTWDRWYLEHPGLEVPPAMVVLSGVEGRELGDGWHPPYDWSGGGGPRETAIRDLTGSLRTAIPPTFTEFVAVALGTSPPFGVTEHLLPTLVGLVHRSERSALIRHFHHLSQQSKARRLVGQVGQQGRRLWKGLRTGRKSHEPGDER